MNTILAFFATIASLFCAATVCTLFHIPAWCCAFLWPGFAIWFAIIGDKHHWFN